jgi:hypothetical protein
MREKPDVVRESSSGEPDGEVERKRIDLSVPQVAGGAVAAVVAARLASYFGVYGTILGAGLVSVIATCGGTLFQHFLTRTGERIRGATAAAAPRGARERRGAREQAPPAPGEFTEGTVHRARARGWRRPVLAAALVFGVTMAGITAYELVSGSSFSGGRSTTVGDALTGHGKSSSGSGDSGGTDGSEDSGRTGDSGGTDVSGGTDGSGGPDGSGSSGPSSAPASPPPDGPGGVTPSGGASPSDGSGTADSPEPAPSASGSEGADGGTAPETGVTPSVTPPAPGASSRSESAVPDPTGPAAP